jgi:hypothetical protein
MAGRGIYLVGSVPLASAAEVFETVSAAFGARIRRIPDGETGARSDWITHLRRCFAAIPPSNARTRYSAFTRARPSGIAIGSRQAKRRKL